MVLIVMQEERREGEERLEGKLKTQFPCELWMCTTQANFYVISTTDGIGVDDIICENVSKMLLVISIG